MRYLFLFAWLLGGMLSAANLYQVSTINALLSGVYDGDVTLGEVLKKGDFGLGTFNGIDGEMIVYEGTVYRVDGEGKLHTPPLQTKTPYAVVSFFEKRKGEPLGAINGFDALKSWLTQNTGCKNYPCAIKIEGTFSYIKVRSEPKMPKPYTALVPYIQAYQRFFEAEKIHGTLIGFYKPEYFGKFNIPGYHFHFLSDDRRFGGHLLDVKVEQAKFSVQQLEGFEMQLLNNDAFKTAELGMKSSDIAHIEEDPKRH